MIAMAGRGGIGADRRRGTVCERFRRKSADRSPGGDTVGSGVKNGPAMLCAHLVPEKTVVGQRRDANSTPGIQVATGPAAFRRADHVCPSSSPPPPSSSSIPM